MRLTNWCRSNGNATSTSRLTSIGAIILLLTAYSAPSYGGPITVTAKASFDGIFNRFDSDGQPAGSGPVRGTVLPVDATINYNDITGTGTGTASVGGMVTQPIQTSFSGTGKLISDTEFGKGRVDGTSIVSSLLPNNADVSGTFDFYTKSATGRWAGSASRNGETVSAAGSWQATLSIEDLSDDIITTSSLKAKDVVVNNDTGAEAMIIDFIPNFRLTLREARTLINLTTGDKEAGTADDIVAFNFRSVITGVSGNAETDDGRIDVKAADGTFKAVGSEDPPKGGWGYLKMDSFPGYWNYNTVKGLANSYYLSAHTNESHLQFFDMPGGPAPGTVTFKTSLIGIREDATYEEYGDPIKWKAIWIGDNDGDSDGESRIRLSNLDPGFANARIEILGASPVPEPSSLALLAMGAVAVCVVHWRGRRRSEGLSGR